MSVSTPMTGTPPTQDQTPHAIPCGHIFCKACLVSVEPSNCPPLSQGIQPRADKKAPRRPARRLGRRDRPPAAPCRLV
ncbi:hypothetical protein C8J57DRAFT_24983 [Mycena rebaudengoi]|nr:hypothetical protein C8J57DRAFT_24983 [Mycena rebaudengoi]